MNDRDEETEEQRAAREAEDPNVKAIKAEFTQKLMMLYGDDQDESKQEDVKFDKLMLIFNRLQD